MKKKNIALLLAMALMMTAVLTACGPKTTDVSGTYTYTISKDDGAGNYYLNGFVAAGGGHMENTLVLNSDKTYTLTKKLISDDSGEMQYGVELLYVFTGTYTNEGTTVTLSKAQDCEFSEEWGLFLTTGEFTNCAGKASHGDVVANWGNDPVDPLDMFASPYYAVSSNAEVKVNVDASANTYSYAQAGSSDDD